MTDDQNPKPRRKRQGKAPEEDLLAPWRSEALAERIRSIGTIIVFHSGAEHVPPGPDILTPLTDIPGYGPDPRPEPEKE